MTKNKIVSIGITLLLSISICLTSCGYHLELPDNAIVFDISYDDDVTIIWNNREYIACGTFTGTKIIGKCLGYYDDQMKSKIYVCQLKGQSEENWLIDTIKLRNCNEGTIYKEKSVTSIPDEIKDYLD